MTANSNGNGNGTLTKLLLAALAAIMLGLSGWALANGVALGRKVERHDECIHGIREDVSEMKGDIKTLLQRGQPR